MSSTIARAPELRPVCEECAIRHRGICSALSRAEIGDLNAIARRRRYDAGQVVQWQAEDAGSVGNVLGGVLKATRTLEDGRVQIVGLLFPGDFVGRAFKSLAPTSIEAATDCEICTFPRGRFEALLKRYPDLENRLFSRVLNELDAAQDWMVVLGRKTAEERVATFLLTIARRFTEIGCEAGRIERRPVFQLPLTRADTADFLGLTIETVSRQITRLRRVGIITVVSNRTVEINDLDALTQAAGETDEDGAG